MTVYRCEDSLESIFTAIYLSYEEDREAEDTYLALDEEPMLFAENVQVQADMSKAVKVMRTLERRFGEEDYLKVCTALASEDSGKAQAVYRAVVKGLDERCARGHLFDDLTDQYVMQTFSLARRTGREIGHLREFLRFQELENGILYARIGPKANVRSRRSSKILPYMTVPGIFSAFTPKGGNGICLRGMNGKNPD